MSLINKLFKGKNTENNAGTQAQPVPEASSQAAADAGCTTTEESARIYAFAKANASQANTEKIFGTKPGFRYSLRESWTSDLIIRYSWRHILRSSGRMILRCRSLFL